MKQAIRIMDTVHEASKAVSEAHPAVPGPAVKSRHTHTGVDMHAHGSGHAHTTSPLILAFPREDGV